MSLCTIRNTEIDLKIRDDAGRSLFELRVMRPNLIIKLFGNSKRFVFNFLLLLLLTIFFMQWHGGANWRVFEKNKKKCNRIFCANRFDLVKRDFPITKQTRTNTGNVIEYKNYSLPEYNNRFDIL